MKEITNIIFSCGVGTLFGLILGFAFLQLQDKTDE